MLIPNNNLVFIAYKTGYCGSLVYALLALSPEVQKFREFCDLKFDDGTAHEVEEKWMPELHDYADSLNFMPEKWDSYLTPEIKKALLNQKLIVARCHPNTAYKLSFIENLKVVYIVTKNKYKFERWAYEKVYKAQQDNFYIENLQRILKSDRVGKVNNIIKRNMLLQNFNHDIKSYHECANVLNIKPHKFDIDQLLDKNYNTYLDLCEYLKITPIGNNKFTTIIEKYNSKQWKRF